MSTTDLLAREFVQQALIAGAVLALLSGLLGPLVVAAVNNSGPLFWLGPLTAGLVLLVLAGLAWRIGSAYALHRAADRKHTVPRFEETGAPWRPWP